jgi:hypothetical protein
VRLRVLHHQERPVVHEEPSRLRRRFEECQPRTGIHPNPGGEGYVRGILLGRRKVDFQVDFRRASSAITSSARESVCAPR